MTRAIPFQPVKPAKRNSGSDVGNLVRPYGAAKRLGITYPMLRQAIELGEIQIITFGGRQYISKSEIERVRKLLAGDEEQP